MTIQDYLVDYNAKLEFWYKHDFNIGVTTYGISDEKDKRDLPENNISIYPENAVVNKKLVIVR